MHRNVLLLSSGFVYYTLAAYALSSFEVGLLVTSLVLFGLPAFILATYSAAPSGVLTSVVIFGTGLAIVLEGVAHIYGIWYTLGVEEFRIFGLIPVEVIFSSVLQTLFLALLYELVFDDGEYTETTPSTRLVSLGVFCVSALILILIHTYLIKGIFFDHSYVWIICALSASTLATLAITKTLSLQFFDRLFSFTLLAALPLFMSLYIAIVNSQRIFAHTHDYLYTFTIGGNIVPLEELLLILILPLFVATFYELYLDDRKLCTT